MKAKILLRIAKLRLAFLVWQTDFMVGRVFLSLTSLAWGISLLNFHEEMSVYSGMFGFLPKDIWAILFIVHFFSSMSAILLGCKVRHAELSEGFLGCFLYTAVTVFLFIGGSKIHAAFSPDAVTALLAIWCYVRYPRYSRD